MLMTRAQLQDAHDRLYAKYLIASEDQFVIVSGTQWAWGTCGGGSGFQLRPMVNPLEGVAVLPERLAKRMQSFTGGRTMSVKDYLKKMLDLLEDSIQKSK